MSFQFLKLLGVELIKQNECDVYVYSVNNDGGSLVVVIECLKCSSGT